VAALLAALLAVLAAAWVYDGTRADGATGGWRALRDAELERSEVGAARIGNSIYVVGGLVSPDGVTTAAVERYDIRRNRWRRAKPMPLPVNHPAVVAYKGFLYVYGGYPDATSPGEETSALQRFDPRGRRWSMLPASPTPRGAAGLAAHDGRLYAVGGANGSALATLEVFDIATRRWHAAAPMGTPREHIATVATRDGIYVFGGRSKTREYDTVERFNPRKGNWTALPPMLTARSGFAAVLVGGDPVVFGGEELSPGGTTIPSVETYEPEQRRWRLLAPMRTPRHGLGGAAMGHRIYALEGGPTPGLDYSNANEFLDVPRGPSG